MKTQEIIEQGITMGIVNDYSPSKLAWYKRPENIPADDLAEATALAEKMSEDESEVKWRMNHYINLRVGYGWLVRCHYPWFMKTHEDALEFLMGMCDHTYGEKVYGGTSNPILGTYENGYRETCSKCGHENYERTSYNNWSGD